MAVVSTRPKVTMATTALNAPAWSFGWHAATIVNDVQNALWVPKPALRLAPTTPKPQPPSLLVIFAESLEATFSRKDIFGEDLTPQLTALAASGKQFTGMRQVSLTAWTTGAMVAAECASPLSAGGGGKTSCRTSPTGWRRRWKAPPAWETC